MVAIVALLILLIVVIWVWRSSSKPVYWFHKKSCPYCVQMQGEWNKFKLMAVASNVRPIAIDISLPENKAMSELYGINSVPTLIKIENGLPYVYDGDRNASDIYAWATRNK